MMPVRMQITTQLSTRQAVDSSTWTLRFDHRCISTSSSTRSHRHRAPQRRPRFNHKHSRQKLPRLATPTAYAHRSSRARQCIQSPRSPSFLILLRAFLTVIGEVSRRSVRCFRRRSSRPPASPRHRPRRLPAPAPRAVPLAAAENIICSPGRLSVCASADGFSVRGAWPIDSCPTPRMRGHKPGTHSAHSHLIQILHACTLIAHESTD
jgi:hypothetical protein